MPGCLQVTGEEEGGGKDVRDRRGLFWLRPRGRTAATVGFGLREPGRASSPACVAAVQERGWHRVPVCDRRCGFGAVWLWYGRVCLRACPVNASTVKGNHFITTRKKKLKKNNMRCLLGWEAAGWYPGGSPARSVPWQRQNIPQL